MEEQAAIAATQGRVEPAWTRPDWLVAAMVPATFFAFEALAVTSYPAMRGPNLPLAGQLLLWAIFYFVWLGVPRAIWALMPAEPFAIHSTAWRRAGMRLGWLAGALCLAHLALLATILRAIHAPPGGRFGDWLHSVGETLLGRTPIWLLAFAVAALAIAVAKPGRAQPQPPPARIELRDRGKTQLVELGEILWVEASGNYVEFHTLSGVVLTRQSLRSVRSQLEQAAFIASHRSALVNACHVKAIKPGDENEAYRIVLSDGSEAPLSRRNLAGFRKAVAGIDPGAATRTH